MKPDMRLPFATLAAVPFVMVLGNSMLIPVFPQMREAMNLSQFQVGLIVTAFSIPAAVLIPFAGALSDHVGRKTVMAPALILYGLGGLVAGGAAVLLPDPYPVLLGGRILQGVGAGGTYLLAMALTGDIFTSAERTKALGLLEAANGLGKVVSPVLGAAVALVAWFAPFFVYGLLAIPVALAVWLLVREPKAEGRSRDLGRYGEALLGVYKRRGVSLLISYAAGMTVLFLLFGVLSFLADDLKARFAITGFMTGLILAIPVTAMAVTAYVAGTVLQDHLAWLKPALLTGVALAGLGLVAGGLGSTLVPLMIAMAVLGTGVGLSLPALNMLITSSAHRTERGVVTAFYGTVRFTGVALGPPAFALATEVSRLFLFWTAAVVAAAALAIAWAWIRPERMLGEELTAKQAG